MPLRKRQKSQKLPLSRTDKGKATSAVNSRTQNQNRNIVRKGESTMTTTPNSIEAEKAVLSAMINDPKESIPVIVRRAASGIFFQPHHELICETIIEMWNSGDVIDIITLTAKLDAKKITGKCGGAGAIGEIFAMVVNHVSVDFYIDILIENKIKREIIIAGRKMIEAASGGLDIEHICEFASKSVFEATHPEKQSGLTTLADIIKVSIDEWEEQMRNPKGALVGLATPFKKLNDMTQGWQGGQMIVIGAPPKGGKTAMLWEIVLQTAVKDGLPVGVINLEMSNRQSAKRAVSQMGNVNFKSFNSGGFSKDDLARMTSAVNAIGKANIFIKDEFSMTPLQFASTARELANKGCKLIVLDYLQLLRAPADDRGGNRERQVAEASRTIKGVAKELNIPIIVASQLNDDGRTRESRAIEMDSDITALIEYPDGDESFGDDSEDEIKSALRLKYHREGPTGAVPLTFVKSCTKFVERFY